MCVRQVLNDAGLQQQMPVFVYKCANIHRHVFQKAYFRKWMHEKLFFDKLNDLHLSGLQLHVKERANATWQILKWLQNNAK